MRLILARHGDTFEPGEKVVWAGTRNDLKLARRGHEQAQAVGQLLLRAQVNLDGIYCSELARTRTFADIVRAELNLAEDPRIDRRLNEIDYGGWTGLSVEEVRRKFGPDGIEGWEQHSRWPHDGGWTETEDQVAGEVRALFGELQGQYARNRTVLLVSSGGRLRYFLKLCAGEFERRIADSSFKVRTGALGLLTDEPAPTILFWNKRADELRPESLIEK